MHGVITGRRGLALKALARSYSECYWIYVLMHLFDLLQLIYTNQPTFERNPT